MKNFLLSLLPLMVSERSSIWILNRLDQKDTLKEINQSFFFFFNRIVPIKKVKIRRSKWVFRSYGVCGKLRCWRRSFEIFFFFKNCCLIFFIPVCAGVSCSCWPWRSSSWRRRRALCELAAPTWRDSASSTADCTSA